MYILEFCSILRRINQFDPSFILRVKYRSLRTRRVIIIASAIICATRGLEPWYRVSLRDYPTEKSLALLLSSPTSVRTSVPGAGSVVVDFLYPPVDNDQHLPQWPESGGAETRS